MDLRDGHPPGRSLAVPAELCCAVLSMLLPWTLRFPLPDEARYGLLHQQQRFTPRSHRTPRRLLPDRLLLWVWVGLTVDRLDNDTPNSRFFLCPQGLLRSSALLQALDALLRRIVDTIPARRTPRVSTQFVEGWGSRTDHSISRNETPPLLNAVCLRVGPRLRELEV